MEKIKELTKRLIANSFKELMLKMPFEKIFIKTITDHANVIRPTFYNHFHDKYELVEWIIQEEILRDVTELIIRGDVKEGVELLFSRFYEDREYYKRAFEITGQNGFMETLSNQLTAMFIKIFEQEARLPKNKILTNQVVAQYYASGLITILKLEVETSGEFNVNDIAEAYHHLVGHTVYEFAKEK